MGIVVFGRTDDVEFKLGEEFVVEIQELKIKLDGFPYGSIREVFTDSLAVGVLDVGKQLSPLSHEVVSSSKQVSGRAHLLGVDIGHGDHASPEQCGDFFGVDSVVFALTAVDGFHVEGMAQDKGDPLWAQRSANHNKYRPVPAESANAPPLNRGVRQGHKMDSEIYFSARIPEYVSQQLLGRLRDRETHLQTQTQHSINKDRG
jgi:hypothetical protein